MTRRRSLAEVEDDASSASGSQRRGGTELELELQNGTLRAMDSESSTKKLLLLVAEDLQDLKLAVRTNTVSN